MKTKAFKKNRGCFATLTIILFMSLATVLPALADGEGPRDLPQILKSGVLHHLGVPYANFITGSGDGMDVELIQGFARHLGVSYEYVATNWKDVIGDLTGKQFKTTGDQVQITGDRPVKGDLIANGLTVLPWRRQLLNYSSPTFPTQIWVLAKADSPMNPITPGKDIASDIQTVKKLLSGTSMFGVADTCLDPSFYGVAETGAQVRMFQGQLNELAPAVINGEAQASLLDVPDALIALDKWPGQVKVIGPLSPIQEMAVGFSKSAPKLEAAFNEYLNKCKTDGTFKALALKYYPAVFKYYPDFFAQK